MLSVQLFALYRLGMGPGGRVLKGFRKPWIFMTFSGGALKNGLLVSGQWPCSHPGGGGIGSTGGSELETYF